MPEPQVNVPAVGKVDRKWIFAGLAAAAGVVVFAYWRNSQAPAVSPEEGDQYAAGDDYTPDAYIGATQPGGETYDPNDGTTNIPTTNQEWSTRAIDALESVGYDRAKVATTIGKYLAGQPLDLAEKLIIQVAIAMLGNPPAGELPIISAPSTPPTTTPPPATTTTKLARPTLRVGAGDPSNTIYQLACNKIPGAIYYDWKRTAGPGSPTSARTIGPSRKTSSLKRGYRYTYVVRAIAPPGKTSSDWSNAVSFTVPRR
jgi:hypothetical protein